MIIAIVGIVHSYDLLPYYLSHYRQLGVERFVIACHPGELDPTGDLTRMFDSQSDIDVVGLPRGFQRSRLVGMIEEEARCRIAGAEHWFIPADLDELNQYPDDIFDLVRRMELDGSTHLTGRLVDRLAPEGALAGLVPFDRGVSIWDQYPIAGDVTSRIAGGTVDKVLLSRGDLAWTLGHHRMRDSPTQRPFGATGAAHHFKWRDCLARSLGWRIENEERARVPWSEESVRLRDYLRIHERIVPEHVNAVQGWRPPSSEITARW